MRTGAGLNDRKHWRARARTVKAERAAVAWALVSSYRPDIPCTILITRVAPSNGLDSDNLAGAMKAVRDAIAGWIGVDDADPQVLYRYEQRRGPWAVEIESRTRGQELERLQAILGAGVKS